MDALSQFCRSRGLFLVEDCSHAHGATYRSDLTGTFGDAAAWSLQTQKLVAAGEGGVLATNLRDVYDRAQLLGHFNKRAQQEMDPSGSLYPYSTTGLGLKYRAHPLGIAFALGQLPHLTTWVERKQVNARRIDAIMREIPGVEPIGMSDAHRTSAYYALVFRLDGPLRGMRNQLVASMHAEGFMDIDIPKATSPLHTLHAFIEPISPVHLYEGSSLRASYRVADDLTSNTIKLSVPCGAGDDGEAEDQLFLNGLETVVSKIVSTGLDSLIQPNV